MGMAVIGLIGLLRLAALGEPPNAGAVVVRNATDATVDVWIDERFAGRIGSRSQSLIVGEADRKLDGPRSMALTCIAEGQDGVLIAATVVEVAGDEVVEAVWGGIAGPALPEVAPEALASPHAGLFTRRWDSLARHEAGRPFRFAETLIGADWNGAPVRGGVLAVRTEARSYIVNSIGMLLVKVPRGSFRIAQRGGPAGRDVTISRDFYMAATETTRGQYGLVTVGEAPGEDADLPVAMVTWAEAAAMCEQLSDIPGWTYGLPTEAQWEYACQAGKLAPFNPGGVDLDKVLWSGANSGGRAHVVGQLLPNDYGLFDMHGNVREWCRSWWDFVPHVGVDPVGPERGNQRVRRGGSFDTWDQWCSAGNRDSGPPDLRAPNLGFRVVLEQDE